MNTSQTQLDQDLSKPEIKKFWLGYFQEVFREETHQQLLEMFEGIVGFTKSDLARKIGRRPEQVTRWLAAPTNLESDTISDMALGMGYVPRLRFVPIQEMFSTGKPNWTNPVSEYVAKSNFVVANSDSQTVLINPNRSQAYQPQSDSAALSEGP
jgi:hypothetical protein